MSYRVKINGVQLFGNNEEYLKWDDFIRKNGIEIDDDGCYSGEITDFMGALVVLEEIVMEMEEVRRKSKRKSLFDCGGIYDNLKNDMNDGYGMSLFDGLMDTVDNSYVFLPYSFFKICEPDLERDKLWGVKDHAHCYKLKEGKTIHVSAG